MVGYLFKHTSSFSLFNSLSSFYYHDYPHYSYQYISDRHLFYAFEQKLRLNQRSNLVVFFSFAWEAKNYLESLLS